MEELTRQELHNLAMNIVGQDMERQGFEFLSINSRLKRNPQFVALKNKQVYFVVVRAISFPEDPKAYDTLLLETIRQHALRHKAVLYYAGVGLANSENYALPVYKDAPYVVNYQGLQKV